MFGGVPKSFFKTYQEHMPKSEPANQYELRATLYTMFHYLNHTVLFGVGASRVPKKLLCTDTDTKGGYASSAEAKMSELLSACPKDGSRKN
jgi:protein-ribulosamine 3-kinase